MPVIISDTKKIAGEKAAQKGAGIIMKSIREKGEASIILATGASQFGMLESLVSQPVDWTKVTAFHLDEYIGIPESHPASFRKYLKERFAEKVAIRAFHFINGNAPPEKECERLGKIISSFLIDVAFIGIGENGHLAFNDPPADFTTTKPYLVVSLDKKCREQQLGEGWFRSLEEVPERAISMSVRQILLSRNIICTVPDLRKARAVQQAVEGPVTPDVPASILQRHENSTIYLDRGSASELRGINTGGGFANG